MNPFDIVGPIMVGPSSSHTAGAVKIGYVSRKLLAQDIKKMQINLYGSFLETGTGHGTKKALIAGALGMLPDDDRIVDSFEIAASMGINVEFGEAKLKDGHPNTAQMILEGVDGRTLEVIGESIGGSRINIAKIDGLSANFSGDYPTMIIHHQDHPGLVAEVSSMLAQESVNIAAMKLNRSSRDGEAIMIVECDQEVPLESVGWIKHLDGVNKVTYYSLLDEGK